MLAFCPRASVKLPAMGLKTEKSHYKIIIILQQFYFLITHFPYSSLENVGRGELREFLLLNGFNNCPFS